MVLLDDKHMVRYNQVVEVDHDEEFENFHD
jgi:hypothetical protein